MRYKVTAHGLFLRKEPRKEPGNERGVLPEGCEVEVLDRSGSWCRVRGKLDGVAFEGWASAQYLAPASDVSFATASKLAPVHWREHNPNSTRNSPASASPIGEPGMPRNTQPSAAQLNKVIAWLAVEQSRRYQPGGGRTYCNIYAHDVAYAADVYLPRVWWTDKAIAELKAGRQVAAQYDVTIREMNANAIHNWLIDYGAHFGWKRTFSLTDLQECAKRGGIATICARRKDLARSGHIVIIAPETADVKARRDANGRVTMPVQSQAGSVNFERRVPASAWWADTRFSSFVLFTNG
ncbi:SH3 domain-containing protein [Sphingomonas sp. BT-65]|uniref:SH3 domain-containing protein n=1 Tax=Sphingomonas sp. BT-65 TaxID=2989821 RepID=UPI0022366C30|nr:SH3 domain-containing protein [Sphingomonas sp. BT-65]MCW4463870.1 SH3 domain-containing protein [Sphingomonas sp. BT-65]